MIRSDFFENTVDALNESLDLITKISDLDEALSLLFEMYGSVYMSRTLIYQKHRYISNLFMNIQTELESMSKCVTSNEELQDFDTHAYNLTKIIKDFLEVVE